MQAPSLAASLAARPSWPRRQGPPVLTRASERSALPFGDDVFELVEIKARGAAGAGGPHRACPMGAGSRGRAEPPAGVHAPAPFPSPAASSTGQGAERKSAAWWRAPLLSSSVRALQGGSCSLRGAGAVGILQGAGAGIPAPSGVTGSVSSDRVHVRLGYAARAGRLGAPPRGWKGLPIGAREMLDASVGPAVPHPPAAGDAPIGLWKYRGRRGGRGGSSPQLCSLCIAAPFCPGVRTPGRLLMFQAWGGSADPRHSTLFSAAPRIST